MTTTTPSKTAKTEAKTETTPTTSKVETPPKTEAALKVETTSKTEAAPVEKKTATPALGVEEPDEPALGDADTGDSDAPASDASGDTPTVYEFRAPEGHTLREPVIEAYKSVLQKHKVTPAVAQEILSTMLPALQADSDAQLKSQIEQKTNEWREQMQTRHGAKSKDVMRLANRALGKAATPELVSFLRDSVLAVNPDFIDMLAYFGQRITNDRSVPRSTDPAPAPELSAQEEAAAQYERELAATAQRGQ